MTGETAATRHEIDAALHRHVTNAEPIPERYCNPLTERDFGIAMAIATATKPGVAPVYDDHDRLVGWRGLRLRRPR